MSVDRRINRIAYQLGMNFTSSPPDPIKGYTLPQVEWVTVEQRDRVAIVRMNRPKKMNALNYQLVHELSLVFQALDQPDTGVGCILLIGNEKVFVAGADLISFISFGWHDLFAHDAVNIREMDTIANTRIPIVAAVNGLALAGGNELAMMCDIIVAGESAKFGQSEINWGLIPGAGGSQRLTRSVGKSKTMELVLTGVDWTAPEAERAGLISRVFPDDQLFDEALKIATRISNKSLIGAKMAKASVLASFETPLQAGIQQERQLFAVAFGLQDKKIGTEAFASKTKPKFIHA